MGTVSIKKNKIERTTGTTNRGYIPQIRSRHPSHNGLRAVLKRLPFRSVIRFGSTTELDVNYRVELNPAEAIKNSSNKLKMKECFDNLKVKTAKWTQLTGDALVSWIQNEKDGVGYPIVAKHHFGSRGTGNYLLRNKKEVEEFFAKQSKNLNRYIFEKYYNYNKEYRLHVTKNGSFYACRKMLRQEFKDTDKAWQRHDDNCSWILPNNPLFEEPNNWKEIEEHCVNALKSCGLDFGACDLRVQNNTDEKNKVRSNPDFIVIEINSAPSFGQITLEKYKEMLPELLIQKNNGN